MGARGEGDPIQELPTTLAPLDAARGTIFFLDWRWLRARGDYDRYVARIAPWARERLPSVTTGEWVPIELLHAHYAALDSLELTHEEAFACGVAVGETLHGSVLRTLARLAGHLGLTPWFAIEQAQKFWGRSWRGGGIRAFRLGDRAARLEIVRNSAARSAFHRGSVAGVISVGIGWLCTHHGIREIETGRGPDSFVLQLDWT